MDATYISCAATAKLIRKALAATYPTVKFSVRSESYAGGASVNIRYTDGPATEDVEAIVQAFAGATFNGMIDLQSYVTRFVDGTPIRYGADYVNVTHEWSLEQKGAILLTIEAATGRLITYRDNDYWELFSEYATQYARRQYPAPVDAEDVAL